MLTEGESSSVFSPVDSALPPQGPASLEIVDFRHSLYEVATNGFVHFEHGFSALAAAEMTREVERFEPLLRAAKYAHFANLRNQRIDRIAFAHPRFQHHTLDQLRALPRINELLGSIELQVAEATGFREHVQTEEWYAEEVYLNRIPPRGKMKKHQDKGFSLFSVIVTLSGEGLLTMYRDPKSRKGILLRHRPGSITFYREPGLLRPDGPQYESLWHGSETGPHEVRWGLAIGYKAKQKSAQ